LQSDDSQQTQVEDHSNGNPTSGRVVNAKRPCSSTRFNGLVGAILATQQAQESNTKIVPAKQGYPVSFFRLFAAIPIAEPAMCREYGKSRPICQAIEKSSVAPVASLSPFATCWVICHASIASVWDDQSVEQILPSHQILPVQQAIKEGMLASARSYELSRNKIHDLQPLCRSRNVGWALLPDKV